MPGVLRTDLAGRVALVTGSSRGLGAAVARQLAASGCDVVVTYRKQQAEAEAVAADVAAAGRRAVVAQLDMEDVGSIAALFELVDDSFGGLDILVANAAASSYRPLMELEPRHIERTFAISVTGFLSAVQRAAPLMVRRGGGRIVAVSGADTRAWLPAHGLLAAAKSAMETMVQYLQCELGERGITVVGVNPGWMDGDSVQMMLGSMYDRLRGMEQLTHPLRRSGTAYDLAEAVALLCTDAAMWFAGSTVVADGAGFFASAGRYALLAGAMPQETVDRMLGSAPSPEAAAGSGGEGPCMPTI